MISCSSQFPFYCSPTCPLLVVAVLLCSSSVGTGLGAITFSFLLAGERTQQEHPHLTLLGAGLGWGSGQALGWGRDKQLFPQLAVNQAAAPSPSDSQLGEKPQHYLSIICDSRTPMAQDPPTLGHPDLWL